MFNKGILLNLSEIKLMFILFYLYLKCLLIKIKMAIVDNLLVDHN